MSAHFAHSAPPLRTHPVTAVVHGLGIITDILLTTHRPWTDAEQAIVDAAEAEDAASDPLSGFISLGVL